MDFDTPGFRALVLLLRGFRHTQIFWDNGLSSEEKSQSPKNNNGLCVRGVWGRTGGWRWMMGVEYHGQTSFLKSFPLSALLLMLGPQMTSEHS